ncbi:Drug/Metabolite transporter (DMT) Superfamily [Phytophthora palmivora]|uniref:Drug/Metabolite transporter (DMT) Superfamily n=1 Tax=Phytophthora palmivora TaxID=4796 RepID=A0A2P4YKQ1_9STRA|nr:Drug/Metabolite transporter (DMT) Superfamily [Phytophthora palmivora]
MVCSIEDCSRERVHYAEVALDDKSLQEPKRLPEVTVVDMRHSGLADVNKVSEQTTTSSKSSFWLLAYCCIGIMVSFTLNGVVLEKITTHRVLGELSMTFVFCVFNSAVAIGLSRARKEKPSTMPQKYLVIVGALAFGSTIASMVALRYVTYITRILGKSCKSIPVMIMGVLLGKKYAFKKYVSVIVLSIGVAIFLLGTAHEKQHRNVHKESHNSLPEQERTPNMVLGFSLLVLSLIFDGATGALEDKFMESYHVGAFDLMYYVNIYKALFSAAGMVVNGEVPVFLQYVVPSLPNLMMLSLTGAFGQAFIFFTISKFGALTTAIIGTCRKVLSIVLSVVLFGHVLSLEQNVGLGLSFLGIGLNWVNMKNCFTKSSPVPTAAAEPVELDDLSKEGLLESSSDDTADSESDEQDVMISTHDEEDEAMSAETARKLELVNAWHRQTTREAETLSSDDDTHDNNDVPAQVV